MSEHPRGSLEGVIVADFSRVLAGPWCSMTLGDLGADVIKVEHPDGDETRGWGPPFVDGESAYFLSTNRNKRSLRLDLRRDDHREAAERLIAKSDVVLENFRPGTMERLGIGEARCRELRSDVIYGSITGFGPESQRPGYDAIIQAMGGVMSITGPTGGPPVKVGVAIGDITAGLYATIAIVSALFARDRGAGGQRVDATLLGTQIAWLANQASNTLNAGVVPDRLGSAHPSIVPYQAFDASDGPFMLAVANEALWGRFVQAIERLDLGEDGRFTNNADRVANRGELVSVLESLFAARTRADWLELFEASGIPAGPINRLNEVFVDPAVLALDLVDTHVDRDGREVSTVRFPVAMSATPATVRRAPPRIGEHDDELFEWLGYGADQIEALRT